MRVRIVIRTNGIGVATLSAAGREPRFRLDFLIAAEGFYPDAWEQLALPLAEPADRRLIGQDRGAVENGRRREREAGDIVAHDAMLDACGLCLEVIERGFHRLAVELAVQAYIKPISMTRDEEHDGDENGTAGHDAGRGMRSRKEVSRAKFRGFQEEQ